MKDLLEKDEFFKVLFNTIPAQVLIVDKHGTIQAINKLTENLLGVKDEEFIMKKGGELFRCIFVKAHPKGCGFSSACEECTVRRTAMAAISGNSISRAKGKLVVQFNQDIQEISLLVSSAPLDYENDRYAIVIVEDISIITELQGLLPMCCSCKKIRDDLGYWKQVEKYLQEHSEVEFTHGYCPECLERLYPQYSVGSD